MKVIVADHLGKKYLRGQHLQPYRSIRETISALPSIAQKQKRKKTPNKKDWFWAIQDISFEIIEGEATAIIGANGAGKSTLLKILSRITKPSNGYAKVFGNVGTLLEVGTGFHPELTGRQNVMLNGAIHGMTRKDIKHRFDEIVEFAGVERFIDTPIKRYSTGMQVRLAFSVSAHLNPDILIVDEVLAVGDATFQKKCLGKLEDIETEGRTVIFVSHNMSAVKQLCPRSILLKDGKIIQDGPSSEVVEFYLQDIPETSSIKRFTIDPTKKVCLLELKISNTENIAKGIFFNSEMLTFEAIYQVNSTIFDNHIILGLYRSDGLAVLKTALDPKDDKQKCRTPGTYKIKFHFPPHILNEGHYQISIAIGRRGLELHDEQRSGYFSIEDATAYETSDFGKHDGMLLMNLESEEEKIAENGV